MVIQQDGIEYEFNKTHSLNTVVSVMRYFKTIKVNDIFQIHLKVLEEKTMCSIHIFYKYLQAFSHQTGILYQFVGGKPVTYTLI